MTDKTKPTEFEDVSEMLKDGLKSCHELVDDYRAVLKGSATEVPQAEAEQAPAHQK